MPKVPTYDNLRTSIAPAQARVSGPMPGEFAGHQMQQMGRALSGAGEAMSRIQLDALAEANQVRVNGAMNDAMAARLELKYGDGGFSNIKGEAALNRQSGKPLGTEYTEALQERLSSIATGLGNDAQRQAFNAQTGQLVAQFRGELAAHETKQFRDYQMSVQAGTTKVAQQQMALDWNNPDAVAQGQEAIKAATAEAGRLQGLSAAEVTANMVTALSPAHQSVITSAMQAGQFDYAESYRKRVEAELTPQAREQLAGALVQAQAQEAADRIMFSGLPLDEAMQHIEHEFSGAQEKAVKAEVASRHAYRDAARREREQQTYGTAQLEFEQGGRVTPATWSQLTDAHRAAILVRQKAETKARRAEAEGKPIRTNWGVYLELREQAVNDPQAFARLDLRQYVDRVGPGQLEQLADLKASLNKDPRDATTLYQQMTATMRGLNLTGDSSRGQFMDWVQREVAAEMQARGRSLTFEERQQIVDRAASQGRDPDAWSVMPDFLAGTRRMYQLTPEQRATFQPNAPTAAPARPAAATDEPVRVNTPAEARTLPPGTRFQGPDGRVFTR